VSPRVADLAGRPHGIAGRLFGHVMAWTNDEMNRFTLGNLALAPEQRVLEIGFGPGLLIEAVPRT
jgi:precorrin-6B methylase 2